MEENYVKLLLQQQNNLLEQTNRLLENQNSLLKKNLDNSPPPPARSEEFVENLWRDEMRSGFLVTVGRKRLWNAQIALINELDRICKKHNLRWFVGDGTLLGAVRHQGFIPWDNDVDIIMLRPDFNKFIRVAADELPKHYFLEVWYNYLLENEGSSRDSVNSNKLLQFISKREKESDGYWSNVDWPKFRLRDKRTTAIWSRYNRDIVQAVWIDVFPLDSVPPFVNNQHAINFEISRELLIAAMYPEWIIQAIKNEQQLLITYEELKKFLDLPFNERGRLAEEFALKNFMSSEYVARTIYYIHRKNSGEPLYPPHRLEWFRDVIYLPFEKIKVPVPVGYEGILKDYYGDWHVPVVNQGHVSIAETSVDVPYKEYYRTAAFMEK